MNETVNTPEVQTEAAATSTEATPKALNSPITVKAVNPTTEEMKAICEAIKVNYDFDVVVKPVKFNFKKQVDKLTKVETIREPVELAIPYPSVNGIVSILESGGKQLELLIDAIEGIVTAQARDLISDDFNINAANFPIAKLSWEHISSIPKAQRRGGGIPKETWEDFAKDYITIMPELTGKTPEQITNAAKLLVAKLSPVKTNEPVLNLLVEQLAVYAEHTKNLEDYKDCVDFLLKKADDLLNISPEELLAAL